jgi:soluble lytic murein transglycosylase
MRLRVVIAIAVSVLGGCRCAQAEEEEIPTIDEAAEINEDLDVGELPALLTAAGSGNTEIVGTVRFKRALQLLRAGDANGARRAFDETAQSAPGLADWAAYFAAHAAASAGDTVLAAARLTQIDPEFRRDYGWRAIAYAHEKAGTLPRAIALAQDAAARMRGNRRFDATAEAARLLLLHGDTVRGRALYITATDSGGTATRIKAAAALSKLSPTAKDWLHIARAQRAAARLSDALASFASAGTPEAQLERAQVLFLQRKYLLAAGELRATVNGTTPVAADAQLLQARAELRLGNTKKAEKGLQAAFGNKGASPLTRAAAAYMLGDLAQDAAQVTDARNWFRAAVAAMPASEPAAQAYMRLGLEAFTKGNFAFAAATFQEFAEAHAHSNYAQQALFWSARAHDRAGQRTRARELMNDVVTRDQFSYYGLSAADWLRLAPSVLSAGPRTPPEVQQQTRGALRRIELLQSLQLTEAASYEQERTRGYLSGQTGGLHYLAEQLQLKGRVAEAITLGRRLNDADGRWNARTLKLIYPFPYRQTIEKHARANSMSPHLLAALIRQESMFNPRAKSTAGAIGLMQVMPKTGRSVAQQIGMKRFGVQQLTDPDTNVRIGTAHFRHLMREHENQLEHVIAAYNAGLTPVARWRSLDHHNDAQLFTERIPYAETREYVKILMRNTMMYELLYPATQRPGTPI